MRWAKPRPGGGHGWTSVFLMFHDLLDDEGNLVGWVREDTRNNPHIYMSMVSDIRGPVFPAVFTLAEAKAQLIHYLTIKRMDET